MEKESTKKLFDEMITTAIEAKNCLYQFGFTSDADDQNIMRRIQELCDRNKKISETNN